MKRAWIIPLSLILVFCTGCGVVGITERPGLSEPVTSELVENNQTNPNEYTDEQLCQMAGDYYNSINGQRPPVIEVDSADGDEVSIHLYEIMQDHTATWDWYFVSRTTAKGTNILGEEIDLTK